MARRKFKTKVGKVLSEIKDVFTPSGRTRLGQLANDMGDAAIKGGTSAEKYGKGYLDRSKGKLMRYQGKAELIRAKAEKRNAKANIYKAKQGAAKVRALAAGATGVASSIASAKTQNTANSAMKEWVNAITSSSEPAEGTGESSHGNDNGSATTGTASGESYPWGNRTRK